MNRQLIVSDIFITV